MAAYAFLEIPRYTLEEAERRRERTERERVEDNKKRGEGRKKVKV